MGQGLYRCLGFGCLNPEINWDEHSELRDLLKASYEAEPQYAMIPMSVDEEFLQESWGLPDLPTEGLPHIAPRTAVEVDQCRYWPDVGKKGVWVPYRIFRMWKTVQEIAKQRGADLPEGKPIFVCDWD